MIETEVDIEEYSACKSGVENKQVYDELNNKKNMTSFSANSTNDEPRITSFHVKIQKGNSLDEGGKKENLLNGDYLTGNPFNRDIERGNPFNDNSSFSTISTSTEGDFNDQHSTNYSNSFTYSGKPGKMLQSNNNNNNTINGNNNNNNNNNNKPLYNFINRTASSNEALRKIQRAARNASAITKSLDGMRYIGKIKLIKCEEEQQPNVMKRTKSVDLCEELKYRDEMETKVADQLSLFKKVDEQQKERLKIEQNEAVKKKEERQKKECDRLRKEEERKLILQKELEEKEKLKIEELKKEEVRKAENRDVDGDPEYIKRERKLIEEAEKAFFCKSKDQVNSRTKNIVKRWNTPEKGDVTKRSNGDIMKRSVSPDSGIIDEDVTEEINIALLETVVDNEKTGYNPEKEREMLEQAEQSFRNFTMKHKTSPGYQTNASLKQKYQRDGNKIGIPINDGDMYASAIVRYDTGTFPDTSNYRSDTWSHSLHRNTFITPNQEEKPLLFEPKSSLEKDDLCARLESAEKKALSAQEAGTRFTKIGDKEQAFNAQEEYHVACLEISRLKRNILKIENELNLSKCKMSSLDESPKYSRECKMPNARVQPPVDKSQYNEEGECVPEGIIHNRMKAFQGI